MANTPHTVGETDAYLKRCAALGVSREDQDGTVNQVSLDPSAGDLIVGTGGMLKVRYAGRGGYRVLVLYLNAESPAYLMSILAKNQQANFTAAQKNTMKTLSASIKQKLRQQGKRKKA